MADVGSGKQSVPCGVRVRGELSSPSSWRERRVDGRTKVLTLLEEEVKRVVPSADLWLVC